MSHPFGMGSLWNKAKVFMERGLVARSEGKEEEWPLWASLAAELLGKAVLAKRHPVLVAHPGNGEDVANSLLSAAGIEVKEGGLQSIQMKTVLLRLNKVLPAEFDTTVQKDLKLIADLRNEELHSGATPLTGLKEHAWAPGFWRAIDILLRDIGKTVRDFVGPEFELLVKELIAATAKEIDAEVKKQLGLAKDRWRVRSEDNGGEEAYRKAVTKEAKKKINSANRATCPVCGCIGELEQNGIELSSVRRAIEFQIVVEKRYRAECFRCEGCSLLLSGTAYLVKAGLPADVTEVLDAQEEWDADYGND